MFRIRENIGPIKKQYFKIIINLINNTTQFKIIKRYVYNNFIEKIKHIIVNLVRIGAVCNESCMYGSEG